MNANSDTGAGAGVKRRIVAKVLEWRSNSIYVYPKAKVDLSDNCDSRENRRKILIGTDTGMKESNYVIQLQYDCDSSSDGVENGISNCNMSIVRKFKHNGNVLKVLGIDDSKCLTASSDNNLYLYNLKQSLSEVSTKPDLMLNEHSKICSGISLNNHSSLLLSSSQDGRVCLWDLGSIGNLGILRPINIFSAHNEKRVNDINWSHCNENIFASGGDDSNIVFYDKRTIDKQSAIKTSSKIVKVEFNFLNPNLFISANGIDITDLWDLRNTKVKLHSFKYHKEAITAIKWSNRNENYFASASLDKSLVFWDIKLLEAYKSPVCIEDNPSEAIHIEYLNKKICDFDWRDELIGVVNMDNSINVMNQSILNII